jgi:hypothetical protein
LLLLTNLHRQSRRYSVRQPLDKRTTFQPAPEADAKRATYQLQVDYYTSEHRLESGRHAFQGIGLAERIQQRLFGENARTWLNLGARS